MCVVTHPCLQFPPEAALEAAHAVHDPGNVQERQSDILLIPEHTGFSPQSSNGTLIICMAVFSHLQFGCFFLISGKQGRLIKVQRKGSGRGRKRLVKYTAKWADAARLDWRRLRPGQLQDVKHHLFVRLVFLHFASVQLERRTLEERQRLRQSSQLYEVQEVEVAEPLRPLACCKVCIKAPSELCYIVTPLLLEPAVWKR